ncbi:hypothetical protein [Variovorax guangxiensis]|uniref:hypothetical protein n=1 Tax=Variovorax guangxiensis TaxID=1775474 RepID=UPI001404449C|nr:hypothetical protein [Variovorax guangxiensis]
MSFTYCWDGEFNSWRAPFKEKQQHPGDEEWEMQKKALLRGKPQQRVQSRRKAECLLRWQRWQRWQRCALLISIQK